MEVNLGTTGILVCLILIIALTPVFAEEYSTRASNILLTTYHGKKKDIMAKIGAAFVFATGLYFLMAAFVFILCGSFYGFGGLDSFYGSAHYAWYPYVAHAVDVSFLTMGQFLLFMIAFSWLGMVLLGAFSLFASAVAKQPFTAIILTMIFYLLPSAGWFYLALYGEKVSQTVKICYDRRKSL